MSRPPYALGRVVVVGPSGAGKSALAKRLARELDCPLVELDELFWGPNWQPKPPGEFLSLVHAAAAGERWVAAGNYNGARRVLWKRADTILWLNFSLALVLRRLVLRTVRRLARREALWHGNRESLQRTLLTRQSIIWWLLTTHATYRRQYAELRRSREYLGLRWHEFTHPSQVERFLAAGGQLIAKEDRMLKDIQIQEVNLVASSKAK